jgi:hypothetical protein
VPDLREQILDHLDVAGARVGEPTHLTTAELVERVDAERPAVEQPLAALRFDHQRVLRGQRLGPDLGDTGGHSTNRDDRLGSECRES